MAFEIESPAFLLANPIPQEFTCDGRDISPELRWRDPPEHTVSYVLIVDDPDAPTGGWDHWILFNIPLGVTELAQDIQSLPEGTRAGLNSWGKKIYGGPCPPDTMHRYFFTLYALNTELDLPEGSTRGEIEQAMRRHIVGKTEYMGKYERRRR